MVGPLCVSTATSESGKSLYSPAEIRSESGLKPEVHAAGPKAGGHQKFGRGVTFEFAQ
ncbi:hypothetical protein K443DRAFT_272234 [Laccaria amethystina LaAM-08-1]|jgi:hypothetical protein|uniref:Uncharacterized protein n=1 Tax=Laccaria amethystina LaAM-08-1 TaxID=1095629 RepID=A0A0C9XGP5_9AGAR|nr:hypothetical protein K443DRAFT_272234 [Laccaria amethystina LaAM-08-1]